MEKNKKEKMSGGEMFQALIILGVSIYAIYLGITIFF